MFNNFVAITGEGGDPTEGLAPEDVADDRVVAIRIAALIGGALAMIILLRAAGLKASVSAQVGG